MTTNTNIIDNQYQPIPQENPDIAIDIPTNDETLGLDDLFKEKAPVSPPDSPYTTDKGVNLKRVAVITLATIGATMAAAAIAATVVAVLGVTVLATAGIPVLPMIIVASVAGGIALAIIGVGLWERITPHLPQSLRNAANWVQSIVTETFGVIALGVLFPINSTWFDPKSEKDCDPNQTPVLMIHGFMGSANNWEYHRHLLRKNGHKNLFTINLGSPAKSIEKCGELVREKVAEIKKLTGRDDLIIVGHSMGGLVAKEYMYHAREKVPVDPAKPEGELKWETNVKEVITMGTPHNGTKMASLASGLFKPAEQMKFNSMFVQVLHNEAGEDGECHYTHIAAIPDAVIVPAASARDSKAKHMEEKWLDATGHVGYLFSRTAGGYMLNAVKRVKDAELKAAAAAA